MVEVKTEITKEQYEAAMRDGVESLIPPYVIYGYGVYGSAVSEVNDKYYLSYSRGDSCD